MDLRNWTLRQKFKVAIPVVLAATFALQNVACSQTSDYTVRNDSPSPLLYVDASDCANLSRDRLHREDWEIIQPGSRADAYAIGTPYCLIVATPDLSEAFSIEFKNDALFVLGLERGRPSAERTGGNDENDEPLGGVLLALIFGVPFLLGVAAASFITLRFFYRYYFRRDKSAQLE